jgi:hypothetical protein
MHWGEQKANLIVSRELADTSLAVDRGAGAFEVVAYSGGKLILDRVTAGRG